MSKNTPPEQPEKRLVAKAGLAVMLDRTETAVMLAASRGHYHLIPKGFKIGRKWYWEVETVEKWITEQAARAAGQPVPPPTPGTTDAPKKRGASTKAERRAKRQAQEAQAVRA